ncbi:unnamed protein product [Cyprideis torosa]|uniref:Uncharacterized protein n=1 Tax=Cyprideis torosa TaxID=163714 RepID=A0A7R8WFU4_9CRUS|nr:unnamed protein product [Cyprideis torosa]CAG0897319.1 unnamed protein product [Cyprideis torosa]
MSAKLERKSRRVRRIVPLRPEVCDRRKSGCRKLAGSETDINLGIIGASRSTTPVLPYNLSSASARQVADWMTNRTTQMVTDLETKMKGITSHLHDDQEFPEREQCIQKIHRPRMAAGDARQEEVLYHQHYHRHHSGHNHHGMKCFKKQSESGRDHTFIPLNRVLKTYVITRPSSTDK